MLQFPKQDTSSTPVDLVDMQPGNAAALKPTKGYTMKGNWRYMVSAMLFLISGSLFLFINSHWGLSLAYIVSLPIFVIAVILVWRNKI